MKKKTDRTGRRNFLFGLIAGTGAVSLALGSGGKAKAAGRASDKKQKGPILYRRTKEAERYYKTLYT